VIGSITNLELFATERVSFMALKLNMVILEMKSKLPQVPLEVAEKFLDPLSLKVYQLLLQLQEQQEKQNKK